MTASAIEHFTRDVVRALHAYGQGATQFVTAHLDSDPEGAPDVVFSPNAPSGRVVCVEFLRSAAPMLSGIHIRNVLRHRDAILAANPGIGYALVTNAKARSWGDGNVALITTNWKDAEMVARKIRDLATRAIDG